MCSTPQDSHVHWLPSEPQSVQQGLQTTALPCDRGHACCFGSMEKSHLIQICEVKKRFLEAVAPGSKT